MDKTKGGKKVAREWVSFDWALKRLLRSKASYCVLEGFLSELLHEDVIIEEVLESEGNQEHEDDKFNRVDVMVRNNKVEFVIIEVQFAYEPDFLQRILYGTSKAITERMKIGNKYTEVCKVISVNILFCKLGEGSDYIYHGTTKYVGIHDGDVLELDRSQKKKYGNDKAVHDLYPEYYLLQVNKFDDLAKNTLDEWIYVLKNGEIKDSFKARGMKEAKLQLSRAAFTEKERRAYDRFIDMQRSWLSIREAAIEEGKEEGKVEGVRKVARNMLLAGIDVKVIVETSGLTEEEIEALKD